MTDEPKPYGPNNPHPLSQLRTELVWEGKYDEYGRRRQVSLPTFPLAMQRIETIDEPRDRSKAQGTLFEPQTAHRDDFRNRLIWGDNKLAMAALLNEFRGQVKLIYIDPPFDVGSDFTLPINLGEDEATIKKERSTLEEVAYRDTWGLDGDAYAHVMYERIVLAKDLLTDDGSIYIHCDHRVSRIIRTLLEEVFSPECFKNEIVWSYKTGGVSKNFFARKHDTIFFYTKSPSGWLFNTQYYKSWQRKQYNYNPAYPEYYDEKEKMWYHMSICRDVWDDVFPIGTDNKERVDYPTQKPEALLERIILASSNEGDLVADFFCGSGTTLAVAENLGRRWIGSDLGRYAIHTTRKRLIRVQRELHEGSKPYRSFDVYNLGRYERQWWQMDRLKGADEEHRATVLKFFRAQPVASAPSPLLHGTKGGAYVHVDSIDSLMTFAELSEVAKAASATGAKTLIALAWEFEMDLRKRAQALEAELQIIIQLKYIPREIMEPNRDEIQFFDAGALDARAVVTKIQGKVSVDVELVNFYPSLTEVPEKELVVLRERAVKSPFDFIDFWAVDFEHDDNKPFEHHWQDFRTKKDRSLATRSTAEWKYPEAGKRRICVKVIDVFGIDTTQVVEVTV